MNDRTKELSLHTKIIALLLVFAFLFFIAACGNADSADTKTSGTADSAKLEPAEMSSTPEVQKTQSRQDKLLADGESGNGRAYTDLGRMYEQGNGVEQDYEKALEYYRLSAEAENPDFKGMRYAGLMYRDGSGVTQDAAEAAACFQLAAEAGDVSAAYFLGLLYEEGNGVDKSVDEAKKWYEKAVSSVDEFLSNTRNNGPDELKQALCKLAEIALSDGDTNSAVKYYQYAVDLGWSAAGEKLLDLGITTENGN